MKRISLASLGAVLLLTTGLAQAQFQSPNPNFNNSTSSNASTASTAGATNAGNAQSITFNSEAQDRLKTTPALGGNSFYGSFSQDGCMVSAGVGFSVVGFGGNGVTPIRDTNCDLRRSFERIEQAAAMQPAKAQQLHQAANDVLCSLGGPVFEAMHNQSLCSDFVVQKNGSSSTKATQRSELRNSFDDLYFTGG